MTAEDDARRIRPFADFLQEHRHGSLHDEAGAALNQLVEAVRAVGKAGSLTITLKVKPAGAGENVTVGDEVKLSLPSPDRPEAIYFIDAEANLTRQDPRQIEMPGVREVRPLAMEPVREIANAD